MVLFACWIHRRGAKRKPAIWLVYYSILSAHCLDLPAPFIINSGTIKSGLDALNVPCSISNLRANCTSDRLTTSTFDPIELVETVSEQAYFFNYVYIILYCEYSELYLITSLVHAVCRLVDGVDCRHSHWWDPGN